MDESVSRRAWMNMRSTRWNNLLDTSGEDGISFKPAGMQVSESPEDSTKSCKQRQKENLAGIGDQTKSGLTSMSLTA